MAEMRTRLFSKEMQKQLFPENEYYKKSKLDVGQEVDKKTVEVSQYTTNATVEVNPTVFPLTISDAVEDVLTYDVDLIATNPTRVGDFEAALVSYNKRSEVIDNHSKVINTRTALNIGDAWALASGLNNNNAAQTSGDKSRPATVTGTSGDRKVVTRSDFSKIVTMFDRDDIPNDGSRYALFTANMYEDLRGIPEFIDYDKTGRPELVKQGILGQIYGVKIMMRSSTFMYSEDTLTSIVKRAIGATIQETDNEAALFWHADFVRRCEGSVKVYADNNVPGYLGSILNAAVRAGGSRGRTDNKGVYMLIQDNV